MSQPTSTWPTQLRLPGQAAAPEGPVDMSMMYVMHHAFRRDLAEFAAAAAATPVSEREVWAALRERWQLFARALHHHHTGEDIGLWPVLLSRVDEVDRQTLEAMEAEHSEIDPILTSCAAGFDRLAGDPDEDCRAALVVRLTAAKESLGRHLAHEETDAIRLVQQHLSDAEWQRLEKTEFTKGITFTEIVGLVPWVVYDLPADAYAWLMARAPLVQRLILRLTRSSFGRRERLAFRYA